MDYGALPPEINSARMYTGAGSEPMLAAAAAWDRIAAELRSTSATYSSVIAGLSTAWLGPSAATMAAAAAPYAAWLTTTAVRAEQTASQARAAAAAYENAFAATVPPPVIAANRARFAALVATNIFGQNTAAIAATEAHYASMWAQDAAAMYGYAAQSAAASAVTPFDPPPRNTNPTAATNQAVAVARATSASAANTQSVLAQWMSAIPSAMQTLAAPASVTTSASPLTALTNVLSSLDSSPLATAAANFDALGQVILPAHTALINTIMALVIPARHLSDIAVGAGSSLAAGLGSGPPASGSPSALGVVSAGVGKAGFVGALPVPSSWAAATPAVRTVAAVLSGTSAGAVSAAAVSEGSLYGAMAVTGIAGGALGAMVPRAASGADGKHRGAARKKLKDGDSPGSLQRLVAEMAAKPDSVQHWHTDSEHLDALLAELRKKPGTHAVHVKSGNSRMKPTQAQPNQVL